MNKLINFVLVIVLILTGAILYVVIQPSEGNLGSITTGQGYNATTTAGIGIKESQQIKASTGQLGSVIVMTSGDYSFNLYDATTTVASNRPVNHQATSSILIGGLVAPMATGTIYIFDVAFVHGLYIDFTGGTHGTTTITYR